MGFFGFRPQKKIPGGALPDETRLMTGLIIERPGAVKAGHRSGHRALGGMGINYGLALDN